MSTRVDKHISTNDSSINQVRESLAVLHTKLNAQEARHKASAAAQEARHKASAAAQDTKHKASAAAQDARHQAATDTQEARYKASTAAHVSHLTDMRDSVATMAAAIRTFISSSE